LCNADGKTTNVQTGKVLIGLNVVKNKPMGETIKQLLRSQDLLKVKKSSSAFNTNHRFRTLTAPG